MGRNKIYDGYKAYQYLKAGFDFVKEGTFGDYKNDYLKAMKILNLT